LTQWNANPSEWGTNWTKLNFIKFKPKWI
jgi:hypothetical protein